jgi:hypothetical protein
LLSKKLLVLYDFASWRYSSCRATLILAFGLALAHLPQALEEFALNKPYKAWASMVGEYNDRRLTYDQGVLTTIAGIVRNPDVRTACETYTDFVH